MFLVVELIAFNFCKISMQYTQLWHATFRKKMHWTVSFDFIDLIEQNM
jgi:hypothetical protein